MKVTKSFFFVAPIIVMMMSLVSSTFAEQYLLAIGAPHAPMPALAFALAALPCFSAAAFGWILLLSTSGAASFAWAGWGVLAGSIGAILALGWRETANFSAVSASLGAREELVSSHHLGNMVGIGVVFLSGCFALRVGLFGKAAFRRSEPRRVRGRRALYGDAAWMQMREAARLFPSVGGIVVGECYRADQSGTGLPPFRADDPQTWGKGGRVKLLCFDGSFGSSHGMVFAGSGGFKTSSVTIPTALKWSGAVVVLDPSNEVAPMVWAHRKSAGRRLQILDPRNPLIGFNALDWIGRFGGTKEEDIASVASWIMSDSGGTRGFRDDFFRASALQLLTALIADVCLSGHTLARDQTLRQVRANLSEPEPKLRERLQSIYESSNSDFVKENVASFVNMTPETFSGVYANAVKETHWLSYPNYAALVSGSTFSTDALAAGQTDVFISLDLKTLEAHSGLARVIIGSFLNAIYNRNGSMRGRTLFLLDEVARLGYMRILETARDVGRRYGITLLMIYQSIGQMRETYGGPDAASKWFESMSWISFAAINDPDTAEYISKRCGMTTVEVDQVSRNTQAKGSSKTRSKLLAARPLIQPHEVLRMRTDEQVVFTSGNPPLRCGRAIWFRRKDMMASVGENRFHPAPSAPKPPFTV